MKKKIYLLPLMFLLVMSMSVYADLTINLTGYYTFDVNGTVNNTVDGTANIIKLYANYTDNCVIGGCYRYNGTSDYYMELNSNTSLYDFSDGGTISIWVKPVDTSTENDYLYFFRKSPTGEPIVLVRKNADDSFLLRWRGTFGNPQRVDLVIPAANVSYGQWNHIAFTHSGNNSNFAYLNGKLIDSDELTNNPGLLNFSMFSPTYSDPRNSLHFGNAPTYGIPANGFIDEIGIWNSELNFSQIVELYNNGSGFRPGSAPDINYTVLLDSPVDKDHFNNYTIPVFNWTTNINQTFAYLEIYDNNSGLIDLNITVNGTSFTPSQDQFIQNNWSRWRVCSYTATVFNCSDYREFFVDTINPVLISNTPNEGGFYVTSLDLDLTISDQFLYKGNLTIKNSTGSVYYTNYTGDITGLTVFSYSESLDITTWPDGSYTALLEATDLHTKKKIKDYHVIKNPSKKQLSFSNDYNVGFDIELVGLDKDLNFKSFDSKKKEDRYSMDYKFTKKKQKSKYKNRFKISSTDKLKYIPSSVYKGWFVTVSDTMTRSEGYWFDAEFSDDNAVYTITKVDDYNYFIDIESENIILDFNSLGGLNYVNKTINFTVDNSPPFVNITYPTGVYGITKLSGEVIDTNLNNVYTSPVFFTFNNTINNTYNFYYDNSVSYSGNVTLFANDSAGNLVSDSNFFIFDVVSPVCTGVDNEIFKENRTYELDLDCSDDISLKSINISCVGGLPYNDTISSISLTNYSYFHILGSMPSETICYISVTDDQNNLTTSYTKRYFKPEPIFYFDFNLNNLQNVILLGLLIFVWLACYTLGFVFRNKGFTGLGFAFGCFVAFILANIHISIMLIMFFTNFIIFWGSIKGQ